MATPLTERPLSLRERQRQEREALILDEAERMLARHGYHDLTMEELAERVGIGKGTIYLHFPRKEDLVRAIVERGMDRMTQRLEAIAADTARSAQARLREIMLQLTEGKEQWVRFLSDQDRREVIESMRNDDDTFRAKRARLAAVLGGVIDEGKERGEFDPSIPTPVAGVSLFTLMHYSDHSMWVESAGLDREAVVDGVMRLYFRGLCARPSETEEAR
jgi:TetR/AcrR family fatty acid metabolism transcriptional regulator